MANDSVRSANEMTTLIGGGTSRLHDGTAAYNTFAFKAFYVATDATFTALDSGSVNMLNSDHHNLAGKTVPAGTFWVAEKGNPYTNVQLATGVIVLVGLIKF